MSGEEFYCPYCQRVIESDEYGIFVHDDVVHPDDFDQEDYDVKH
jgi:hypothetical protein